MTDVSLAAAVKETVTKMQFAQTQDELINTLLSGINKAINADGSAFFVVETRHNHLMGYLGQPPEHWPNLQKVAVSLNEPVHCVDVVKTKQPIIVKQAEKDPKMVSWLVRYYKCKSALLWPLLVDNKAVGCLVISQSKKERTFTNQEIQAVNYLITTASRILTQRQEQKKKQVGS